MNEEFNLDDLMNLEDNQNNQNNQENNQGNQESTEEGTLSILNNVQDIENYPILNSLKTLFETFNDEGISPKEASELIVNFDNRNNLITIKGDIPCGLLISLEDNENLDKTNSFFEKLFSKFKIEGFQSYQVNDEESGEENSFIIYLQEQINSLKYNDSFKIFKEHLEILYKKE